MSDETQVLAGRIKEAAGALTDNDQLRAEGRAEQAGCQVEKAARSVVEKVKSVARTAVSKVTGHRPLMFLAVLSAAVALSAGIVLAEGGGGRGGRGGGNGGGGGAARVNAGGGNRGGQGAAVSRGNTAVNRGNAAVNQGSAATAHVGVVRSNTGVANQPGRTNVAPTSPSFIRNNISNQPTGANRNALGGNVNATAGVNAGVAASARSGNPSTNNAILHNSQLSGQHWNGNWNNNHNSGYWNNRSFFFGGGSPFGYGNGAYAYQNNPYGYGFGGLGYGLGGLGVGMAGYGMGGYGAGGYGGYPSYGSYNTGANQYASNQGAPNDNLANVAPASAPAQSADDALDFGGHGELDFKAGNYEGAVRNWKHALVEDPNNGALVLLMAQGLFALGEYDQAAGATQMAMQMLPQDKWGAVIEHYKELYGNIGDYTTQLKALENARTSKPTDSGLRFLLGFHFGYLGYSKQAVRELDKSLELNAKDDGARKVREIFAGKQGLTPSSPAPAEATGQSVNPTAVPVQ